MTQPISTLEVWKVIPGWAYEVSNMGRVRRCTHYKRQYPAGRILKGGTANGGYPIVTLRNSYTKRRREVQVHILVAEVFIGPRPTGKELHHKDNNPRNAALANLEYVTASENIRYSVANGHRGSNRWNARLTDDLVRWIKVYHDDFKQSVPFISGALNVTESSVYHVIRGRNWRHVR